MNNGEDWTEVTAREAEEAIGYVFLDKELLYRAFTHTSFGNLAGVNDNERLEFLGDAVLELCVTERLFAKVEKDEGELTELRKRYVSRAALGEAEKRLSLMRFLRFSGSAQNVAGKTASNLFEAVVGGIYLDGGLDAAKKFLEKNLILAPSENYKTELQEFVQERIKATPYYETTAAEGQFYCRVTALGRSAEGNGTSKKSAETAAAKALLMILKEEEKRKNGEF